MLLDNADVTHLAIKPLPDFQRGYICVWISIFLDTLHVKIKSVSVTLRLWLLTDISNSLWCIQMGIRGKQACFCCNWVQSLLKFSSFSLADSVRYLFFVTQVILWASLISFSLYHLFYGYDNNKASLFLALKKICVPCCKQTGHMITNIKKYKGQRKVCIDKTLVSCEL